VDDTADQGSCGKKEFGIIAVTVAGGSIKVKNEVRVEFEMVAR
jgi:hypothetical protein